MKRENDAFLKEELDQIDEQEIDRDCFAAEAGEAEADEDLMAPEAEADFFDYPLESGTQILMCSDGLTNMVEKEGIEAVLRMDATPEEKARLLINAANDNGGKDNIAVIIIEPDAE